MTILLSFVFLHGERPRGGDQTCTSLCADVRGIFGAGKRLWRASVIMKWAHYGETGCLFWLIILLLMLLPLLLANSVGKMFKRPFGMNHYKRGGSRRDKNMDYLLHQACIKGLHLLEYIVDAAMHVPVNTPSVLCV